LGNQLSANPISMHVWGSFWPQIFPPSICNSLQFFAFSCQLYSFWGRWS
jgi:hypothetical protein